MQAPLAFFKFGVKASLNAVLFGVGGDLVVEVLPSVAKDLWKWWARTKRKMIRGKALGHETCLGHRA